ncbi:beta-galactosidase [Paenibacillus agricola]|uniref:beta-galactosidase n=1 Tax=Paenibacillus agricola TaxID=2716264 RepID=A0ABX0JD76_9BACL|nr:beta-galactosidase [Paenibacillus agricola]NHN34112.1 beta-galactosidase [Paenibacillus agricola]
MAKKKLPQVPYGAVYFRKSNPPQEDWERDYAVAREDGYNMFRHWFMWSAIEVAPGVFDWEEYDQHMELAAKNGIQTVISEMMTFAPEWAFTKYPDALHTNVDGKKIHSMMGGSSAVGGYGGLCFDSDEVKALGERFLTELVMHYKDHPSMVGYDILNECNFQTTGMCYCEHSRAKYRQWLQAKYGDLKTLGVTWRRYSYTDWNDVQPPAKVGLYPESFDWIEFNKQNLYAKMKWRSDLIASLDTDNYITAHGEAASLVKMAASGSDDWESARHVEIYGFTWVATRKGSDPWKQWHAVDLTRSGSNGKPFWHAEMQGGPLWLQPQLTGRPRQDGRITKAEDIRLWNMISLAGGATGLLFPRWRPLLDGPLFGAFGPYEMDGSRTDRSAMASSIAKWANEPAQASLFSSSPIKGDIGILVVPETETFNHIYSREVKCDYYSSTMWGAYRGFFDNNLQPDWVHIDQIDAYEVIYFPYPIMLKQAQAQKLKQWVKRGGTLICEGCPAYFGDFGTVGTVQPNLGLDEVFGARQQHVEFMPDIADPIVFEINGAAVKGGVFLQSYKLTTGTAIGNYEDGTIAAVENSFGAGKVLLVGTFPSEAYYRTSDAGTKKFFADVFTWSGKEQSVRVNNPLVQVRLHEGSGGKFVWIINSSDAEAAVELHISDKFAQVSVVEKLWGEPEAEFQGNQLKVALPAKDALILKLQ